MFKKKAPKVVEPDGYLGELNERQTQALLSFKEWLAAKGWVGNPWFTDTHLLKFCRARNFELEKV